METTTGVKRMVVYHGSFNLTGKDNLEELPAEKAVFGVFGMVGGEGVNCRYVGETENLRQAVRTLFEDAGDSGLKKFMQGGWIQMVQYELMADATQAAMERVAGSWTLLYKPLVDEEGEYPGYYDN
jgi:hypothetical protein